MGPSDGTALVLAIQAAEPDLDPITIISVLQAAGNAMHNPAVRSSCVAHGQNQLCCLDVGKFLPRPEELEPFAPIEVLELSSEGLDEEEAEVGPKRRGRAPADA